MKFDNHDSRIRYYHLLLERNLQEIPSYNLPAGFCFSNYRAGDREAWIAIERSARELESQEQGIQVWERYYGGHEEELTDRMFFIENSQGEKVATATAYYDPFGEDGSDSGWLHWVAVRRDFQGMGLSKPLISHTLNRLRELGYPRVRLSTQTTTWLACKIYLDFGFRPLPENVEESRKGWRIVKALTNHPALSEFDPAKLQEILRQDGE